MIAEEAYVLSKSFTKKSLDGQGALKGAPCTIKSITEVDGGQKVTFEWTGTSGTKQTSTMIVKNGVSVTGISDKGNGVFTLLLSDGSESDPIQCVKGEDGFSPTATVEKVGKVATITITDKNGTTTATVKDGEGSEGGEANIIDSISVNGVNVVPDENKNVDITVPSIEGLAKTTDIPTKVSQLENDSNYLSSIPEEYVTETELEAKGYLTEHQDISGKVDKVEGKSLISDTEIARLATVDNYDDTDIKAEIAKKADATAIPSKVSELTNDSNYQTAEQVNSTVTTEIAKVVADAPEDLNTLKEMSDWIAGHENDASAMNSAIKDNKDAITALQTGKADASDLTAHTDDTDIHVTKELKDKLVTTDDIATTISSTSTDSEVPTAKAVNEKVKTTEEAMKELLKYKDITSECVFRTDSLGSNGKLPEVYKNCNSIVINWNGATVDAVDASVNYGHIKIPKNSNCTYIINETFTIISDFGIPKGLVRIFIDDKLDDYIYVTVTGQMFAGTITIGTDTIRGLTEFKFIEN